MCNNTLGNLIIWGILSIFGAIFWGDALLKSSIYFL